MKDDEKKHNTKKHDDTNNPENYSRHSRYIWLGIVIVVVLASIIYLEMQKVRPITIPVNPSNNNYNNGNDTTDNTNALGAPTETINGNTYPRAPELSGIDSWINSEPLTMGSLKGKVVLVDFWTYSCINCLRTLPYLNSWNEKYKNDGLVIIGVHTPEFAFEKINSNVLMAVKKYGIGYPVALDNNYGTWDAYGNQYWPRKYLIDKNGYIRYDHIGEGGYDETEMQIQQLLSETGVHVNYTLSNITDETPTTQNTQELYLGYTYALERAQNIGNNLGLIPDIEKNYTIEYDSSNSPKLLNDIPYLEGFWKSASETVTTTRNTTASLYLKFTAKKAHVVLEGPIGAKIYVTVDGKDVTTQDVHDGYFTIDGPRLYTLYDGTYGTYTLKISTNAQGIEIDSFTFG